MKNLIAVISLVVLLASTHFNNAQAEAVRAWGWFDNISASSFTLNSSYQYNSRGGSLTGKRTSKGNYQVIIPNMGRYYAGVCHAVAYQGKHSVQIVNWSASRNDLVVNVKAFNSAGNATDGRFVIFFYKEAFNTGAYTWMSSPGKATHGYAYNSARKTNSVKKIGEGRYSVSFPGLSPDRYNGKKGSVIVTPYGSKARRAQIVSWGLSENSGARITVQMSDANGNAADSKFVISFLNNFNLGQRNNSESADYGAFVWANKASSTSSYAPSPTYLKNNSGRDNIKISRLAKGSYRVHIAGVKAHSSTMAIATSYGNNKTYATVQSWGENRAGGGTEVYVKCYNANGSLTDSMFTLFYYTNENILY